jgi:transcriptional regulator with XRE-family HTH domain
MVKYRRHELQAEAARRNRAQLAAVGAQIRAARRRRRWTQQQLAGRVGLSRSAVSAIERGLGGGHTFDTWQRIAVALDIPLSVELGRDPYEEPADAGHLRIQELVLRVARDAGFTGTFELPTRPLDPRHAADCGLLDRLRRRLIIAECWNTIGDLGAGARSTNRKVAEAGAFAVSVFGEGPVEVGACWIVRDTRRNRALFDAYPEIIRSRFPGSSDAWVAALTHGGPIPKEPGIVWCDVAATRIYARRPRRR